MQKSILLVCLVFVLYSCAEHKPLDGPKVLMDADLAFSDYSVKHGIHKAFIEFAHDSVVLLKDKNMPIIGMQSLIKSYEGQSDSGVVLTWKPEKAFMAKSGELGYTYGFWTFNSAKDTTHGTYLTIWKKDADGNWKYIADTGNQGLK